MTTRYVPICEGNLTTDPNGVISCVGQLHNVDASGIPGAFDISTLDPMILSGYFGAAFIIVGTFALVGYSVKAILSLLK